MEGILSVVWIFALAAAPAWFFLKMALHLFAMSDHARSRTDDIVMHLFPFAFLDPRRYTPQGVKELEKFKRSFALFALSAVIALLLSMLAESFGWPAQQSVEADGHAVEQLLRLPRPVA